MTNKLQLPSVDECIQYVESLGYTLKHRTRGYYLFTTTVPRPQHNTTMQWSLNELRHAKKFGC